jgi:hypothetical protein
MVRVFVVIRVAVAFAMRHSRCLLRGAHRRKTPSVESEPIRATFGLRVTVSRRQRVKGEHLGRSLKTDLSKESIFNCRLRPESPSKCSVTPEGLVIRSTAVSSTGPLCVLLPQAPPLSCLQALLQLSCRRQSRMATPRKTSTLRNAESGGHAGLESVDMFTVEFSRQDSVLRLEPQLRGSTCTWQRKRRC